MPTTAPNPLRITLALRNLDSAALDLQPQIVDLDDVAAGRLLCGIYAAIRQLNERLSNSTTTNQGA